MIGRSSAAHAAAAGVAACRRLQRPVVGSKHLLSSGRTPRTLPWALSRAAASTTSVPLAQERSEAPHVAVIGTGLVGLTSAHSLLRRGMRVTLIDRQPGVAGECSYANAALLMRSYSRPKTATVPQLLRWATRRTEPVHVSWRALVDPSMTAFGLRFLLSGPQTDAVTEQTTQITDALAHLSVNQIEAIVAERKLEVSMTRGGVLMYFRDRKKLQALVEENEGVFAPEQRDERYRVVSAEECVELEPVLSKQADQIVGGVFWHADKTICPLTFSKALASSLAEDGVRFMQGEEVVSTSPGSGGAGSACSLKLKSGQEVAADAVVLAAGVGTGALLKRLSPAGAPPLPLYGMRGHSLTVDASHLPPSGLNDHCLRRSICDADSMVFFSPLPRNGSDPSDRPLLRVVAFGDFDGWGYGPGAVRDWRVQQMVDVAKRNFGEDFFAPEAAAALKAPPAQGTSLGSELCPAADASTRWTGLRPMSPDGLPIVGGVGSVGRAPVFVNTGHGSLGWTLSAGSGEVLADAVAAALPCGGDSAGAAAANGEAAAFAAPLQPQRFRWPEVLRRAARMRLPGGGGSAATASAPPSAAA